MNKLDFQEETKQVVRNQSIIWHSICTEDGKL